MPDTWEDLVIVVPEDIVRRVRSVYTVLQCNDDNGPPVVQVMIDDEKDELRQFLLGRLQDIYATSAIAGITWDGYLQYLINLGFLPGYDQTDSMLDTLFNPMELKAAMISGVMVRVYEDASEQYRQNFAENMSEFGDHIKHWQKRKCEDRELAIKLLKFDIDRDGVVGYYDRVRTHTTWSRV